MRLLLVARRPHDRRQPGARAARRGLRGVDCVRRPRRQRDPRAPCVRPQCCSTSACPIAAQWGSGLTCWRTLRESASDKTLAIVRHRGATRSVTAAGRVESGAGSTTLVKPSELDELNARYCSAVLRRQRRARRAGVGSTARLARSGDAPWSAPAVNAAGGAVGAFEFAVLEALPARPGATLPSRAQLRTRPYGWCDEYREQRGTSVYIHRCASSAPKRHVRGVDRRANSAVGAPSVRALTGKQSLWTGSRLRAPAALARHRAGRLILGWI